MSIQTAESNEQHLQHALATARQALNIARRHLWDLSHDTHMFFCACAERDLGTARDRFARLYSALNEHIEVTEKLRQEERKAYGQSTEPAIDFGLNSGH